MPLEVKHGETINGTSFNKINYKPDSRKLTKMTKENSTNKLLLPVKEVAKKISVRLLRASLQTARAAYRLSQRVSHFAERQGFDFERELPPVFSRFLNNSQNIEPFDASDFLLLAQASAAPQTVKTSIIILVYNKVEFTFQCLRSLFREVDLTENEIIVIDNASSDETPRLLELLKTKIRVIRNEDNKGFVGGCNQGAAAARGKYVVFLNNDTIVRPRWLDALTETIEADEIVGAVGSMLIYPNGHIQEAGGIVWSNAAAANYGSGENPRDLRFNFAREVDYCSGASLLLKKELFERLGGFDTRFAPAYYEDTDLCMSVRAAGYKVIYQPESRLIHFEGATAGTNTQSGYKRFQEINRHKFYDKWRDRLEREHLAADKKNISAASNRRRGRLITVFFHQVPRPDSDSGSVRMFDILRALSRSNRVVLVNIHKNKNDAVYEKQLGRIGVEVVWIVNLPKRFHNDKCYAAILCYPDVADLMLPKVRKMFPEAKLIYDTVDIHFVRLGREFQLTGDKHTAETAEQNKVVETRLARAASQVWCVTEDDKKFLQAVAPTAKIEVIPNIHALHNRGKSFTERRNLIFIGSFAHRPNGDAVTYFVNEIFPFVLEKLPDVQFHIVGSDPPPELFALNSSNVRVEGFVRDVNPLFESCRVFVSPLRYGAGMKGKIGQAFAFGLPTVTTRIGAEGMNLTDGQEVLIADESAHFADQIVRLYQSPELWQRLSDNGYRYIEENFSPQVIDSKVTAAVEKALNQ